MNTQSAFAISAFGDEVSTELEEQLRVLAELKIGGLELRGALGTGVSGLTDEQARRVKQMCDDAGIVVTCLGSPVGKSQIGDAPDDEEKRLQRLFEIGEIVGTKNIRIFSFYPPEGENSDDFLDASIARLRRLTELAEKADFRLMLENEVGLIGDLPPRCAAIMKAIDSPHLRFAWDSANFVLSGMPQPIDNGWDELAPFVGYVHIKDAVLESGAICVAGEGQGQIPELIEKLMQRNYRGVLALEPHLVVAGHSGGFSGEDGMTHAAAALRRVLADAGANEVTVKEILA